MSITQSTGVKRTLAGATDALSSILSFVPTVSAVLQSISAFFATTGLAHATIAGTISAPKTLAATGASLLSIFVLVAQSVPVLTPYIAFAQNIAVFLGGAGVAQALTKTTTTPVTISTPSN